MPSWRLMNNFIFYVRAKVNWTSSPHLLSRRSWTDIVAASFYLWPHPCILPEPGQTSPPRIAGPWKNEGSPTIPTSRQKTVPSIRPRPRSWVITSVLKVQYQDERGQGKSSVLLAYTNHHKDLQCFIGFANFYQCSIMNYSSITTPLTSFLKDKPKSLPWTQDVTQALQNLKQAFTTAPLFVYLSPDKPSLAEMDTSTTGVETLLQQPRMCHVQSPSPFTIWQTTPAASSMATVISYPRRPSLCNGNCWTHVQSHIS